MEAPKNRISRRRMLKRIGAGAAVAWSAPIISSLRTPAFAQGYPTRCSGRDWNCDFAPEPCGTSNCNLPDCLCDIDVEGNNFCWNNYFCLDPQVTTCTTSADCTSAGWRCVTSCCGQTCAPPCGDCTGSDLARVQTAETGKGTW